MKINYKNTALGLIDDPKNFSFGFPDPDITPALTPDELRSFGKSLIKTSSTLKELCGNNIQYVSSAFYEAFKKGSHKLKPLLHNEEIEDAGILITGGFTNGYTHMHTIYYTVTTVKLENGSLFYNVLFMDFSKHAKADECALDAYVTAVANLNKKTVDTRCVIWNGYTEEGRDELFWQAFIISFCLFKKYCDIETKEISPTNRRAKVAGQKYLNETDKRIKILDCTWFTNLVVSGKFMVGDETGGFLNWFYYGPGKKQKRLQWVMPYEKQGYTRKAKVLMQEGKNDDV